MKTFWILLFLVTGFGLQAQLNITTDFRQDAVWNLETENWDVLSSDEGVTFFEFNRELSLFKHTTNSIASSYIIKEFEYDEENAKYTMLVVSDVGNEYDMIVDALNNYVGFFYWYDEDYVLVRHTIKKIWFKE